MTELKPDAFKIEPDKLEEIIRKLKDDDETLKMIDLSKVPSSTDLSGWKRLTDPKKHSDTDFRYLVHAVVSETDVGHSRQQQFLCQEILRDPTIPYNRIDILATPERIAEKGVISTSLIDSEHRETWRAGGYILRVPTDNILKTHSQDVGTQFHTGEKTREALYRERDEKGLANPDTILQCTSPHAYNEVVVAGTGRTGRKVEIAGVFVKVFPNREQVDESLARRVRSIAYSRQLPVLEIQESFNPYKEEGPGVFPNSFNYVIGDRLYLFQNEHSSFTLLEYGGKKSRPMLPHERTKMVDAVRKHLASTPNPELEAMVTVAEIVPDHKLQEQVEQHYRWKQRDGMFGSFDLRKLPGDPSLDVYGLGQFKYFEIRKIK